MYNKYGDIMKVTHNLNPIYDQNSKVLILGSMPSTISREYHFYYANKSNRFWKIIETLFSVKLEDNQQKENFLIQNKIALWDVIKSCDIEGSSDSTIKNIVVNDIPMILNKSNIQCVFCTGKKAYELFKKYFKIDIEVIYLPSPSSANAVKSLEELIVDYKKIPEVLNQ